MQNSLLDVQKKVLPKNLSLKISSGHIDFRFESPVEKLLPVVGKFVTQIPPKNMRHWFFPGNFSSKFCTVHFKTVLTTHLEKSTEISNFFAQSPKTRRKIKKFQIKQLWLKRCSLHGKSSFEVPAVVFLPKKESYVPKIPKKKIWFMFAEEKKFP